MTVAPATSTAQRECKLLARGRTSSRWDEPLRFFRGQTRDSADDPLRRDEPAEPVTPEGRLLEEPCRCAAGRATRGACRQTACVLGLLSAPKIQRIGKKM